MTTFNEEFVAAYREMVKRIKPKASLSTTYVHHLLDPLRAKKENVVYENVETNSLGCPLEKNFFEDELLTYPEYVSWLENRFDTRGNSNSAITTLSGALPSFDYIDEQTRHTSFAEDIAKALGIGEAYPYRTKLKVSSSKLLLQKNKIIIDDIDCRGHSAQHQLDELYASVLTLFNRKGYIQQEFDSAYQSKIIKDNIILNKSYSIEYNKPMEIQIVKDGKTSILNCSYIKLDLTKGHCPGTQYASLTITYTTALLDNCLKLLHIQSL